MEDIQRLRKHPRSGEEIQLLLLEMIKTKPMNAGELMLKTRTGWSVCGKYLANLKEAKLVYEENVYDNTTGFNCWKWFPVRMTSLNKSGKGSR